MNLENNSILNEKGDINKGNGKYENDISQKKYKPNPPTNIILDKINLSIIEQIINNPNIKSSEISKNLQIPLSTIQRRRHTLEIKSIFKKKYVIDLSKFNLRVADILLGVDKGQGRSILKEIQNNYKKQIIDSAIRIGDPKINISIKVIYKNSVELFYILENLKSFPHISVLSWSEVIKKENNNQLSIADIIDNNEHFSQ